MKTMTCKQLGSACELTFQASTFEEIAKLSQTHGILMQQKQEPAHLAAMQRMSLLMQDPHKLQQWLQARKAEFDALEND